MKFLFFFSLRLFGSEGSIGLCNLHVHGIDLRLVDLLGFGSLEFESCSQDTILHREGVSRWQK